MGLVPAAWEGQLLAPRVGGAGPAGLRLLLLCNVQPARNLPVIFEHDAWSIIFMAAFAFSNGYLASLCMLWAQVSGEYGGLRQGLVLQLGTSAEESGKRET